MKRLKYKLQGWLSVILIIWVWLFPVFLSAYKDNWWLLFTYIVWFIPAGIITGIILTFTE
jgi:uncharacterized membrane protein